VPDLLKAAIAGLNINVPIYRTEEQDGVLILYLYGGRVVRWPPSTMATASDVAERDPVTTSPPSPSASPPSPSPIPKGDEVPGPGEGEGRGGGEVLDNLTKIPGIGKATAQALNNAGFHNFRSLIDAEDADILAVPKLNAYLLARIRSYLYVHFL